MTFGIDFITDLVERSQSACSLEEQAGPDDGPLRALVRADNDAQSAGYVRRWIGRGNHLIDRMIHFRLQSDPVDTQLFFLFGRSDTAMPHFHAQVVQFSPDACVFNADWLPRLDPIDHPDYYTEVFGPITKVYWKAINDRENMCALAPANPAIAAYLAPWSIGVGRPTTRAELDTVTPQIHAFLAHYLHLAGGFDYPVDDSEALRARDARHLDTFFSDHLDPRAWKGVYGVIGEAPGRELKQILKSSLHN
jgi:hypothetical protein